MARREAYAFAAAGAMAQNVYLYCASAGLATVIRAWFDAGALSRAMGLGPEQQVLLAQTVGRRPRRGVETQRSPDDERPDQEPGADASARRLTSRRRRSRNARSGAFGASASARSYASAASGQRSRRRSSSARAAW